MIFNKKNGKKKNCNNDEGFTLIEVMIAVSILAIGVLAVAMMQIQAVKNNTYSWETTAAMNIARTTMEELKLLAFGDAQLVDFIQGNNLESPTRRAVLIGGNTYINGAEHRLSNVIDLLPVFGVGQTVFRQNREFFVYWNVNDFQTPSNGNAKEISVIVARVADGGRAVHWHNIKGVKLEI